MWYWLVVQQNSCSARKYKKRFWERVKTFGNPDESVALGAAIYAAYKSVKNLNPLQKQAISKLSMSEAVRIILGLWQWENQYGILEKQNSIIISGWKNSIS